MALPIYPQIKYFDSSHLYWKEFPYKVVIRIPWRETLSDPKRRAILRRDKNRCVKRHALYCPFDSGVSWRLSVSARIANFFFKNEADAAHFIAKARDAIRAVYRPASVEALDVMRTDTKVKVRKHLFWGHYRWRIVFRALTDDQERDLCDWVHKVFECDKNKTQVFAERCLLSLGAQTRLFLTEENDVLVVKLGFSSRIAVIERAVLAEEVNAV